MNEVSLNKFLYWISFMIMASTFLPVVFFNLPKGFSSQNLWQFIWIFSLLLFNFKILINKAIMNVCVFILMFYCAINTIWRNFDDWNYALITDDYKNIFIALSIISYYILNKEYYYLAKLTKWSILFLFITAIMSIIASEINPMYVRNITGIGALTNQNERETVLGFRKFGGGNYSIAIVFMSIFPILIFYFKNIPISLLSKRWILFFATVFFVALLQMQIFANVIIAFLFGIIAMLGAEKIRKTIYVFGVCFFIYITIPNSIYVKTFVSISNFFNKDSELNYKFKDLAEFIESGSDIESENSSVSYRAERYPALFNLFLKSPILGNYFLSDMHEDQYYQDIGASHLYWMNKLTTTGLVGLAVFALIFYFHINVILKYFNSNFKFYYLLSVVSFLSYGLFKNMGGKESWFAFFIILPGMYYLPLLKKANKNKVVQSF